MRGPLTCLVVFALMVMTPFTDPQIALASDYVESLTWDPMEARLSEQTEMPVENELTEIMTVSVTSELAMDELSMVAEEPVVDQEVEESVFVNKGPIIQQKQKMPLPQWRIEITTAQLDLLERCVMAEGGGESYECQVAIACVIINRVLNEDYPDTIEEVIKQDGQFSTWPTMIKRANPTNEVKQAVREALTSEVIPENVLYFRANRYHRWGSRYCRMDNTYFSTP